MNRGKAAQHPVSAKAPGSINIGDQIERLAADICAHDRVQSRPFMALLKVLEPRIGRLIRQYGLGDMGDDAQQAAAIGVCRALSSYDRDKASFSTHVTWQIRGELQSLRHRMRIDQRRSARTAGIATVSLDALSLTADGAGTPFEIVDERACERTESGASDAMAITALNTCLNRLNAPSEERAIVLDHIRGNSNSAKGTSQQTAEQHRQIVRRTLRNCAKLVAA